MQIVKNNLRLDRLKEIEKILKNKPENHLYIWGGSNTAKRVTDFIKNNSSIDIKAYIVDDKYYQNNFFEGKKVLKASEWLGIVKAGDFVWMGFINFQKGQALKESLPEGVNGFYFSYPISERIQGKILTYEYYQEYKNQFDWLYDRLADEKSKRVYKAFLNASISGDALCLEKEHTFNQYFNEITKDYLIRSFIDCGAYIGDSIAAAIVSYSDYLENIIAFEPDEASMKKLKEMAAKTNIPKENWYFVQKGTWNQKTVLHFSSNGETSSVKETGEIEIQVDTIDHIISSFHDFKVDFIKMDVEGSEKETLLGAFDTIKRDKPILAVSVYHKIEDIYEVPCIIERIIKNSYKYYLRYHGTNLCDVVLYAIPIEKD